MHGIAAGGSVLAACAPQAAQIVEKPVVQTVVVEKIVEVEKLATVVVEKPVEVEKKVVETVVVEKAVPVEVEKKVVETVIVEKPVEVEKKVVETVIVEREVEVEKVVTAAPARINIPISPSLKASRYTCCEPGRIIQRTLGCTFLPFNISAASRKSLRRPLVQLPITA